MFVFFLPNRVLFSDRDEAKLIIDLERQLADKQVNMADLRRTMYDLDRDRNDFLSGEQVRGQREREKERESEREKT